MVLSIAVVHLCYTAIYIYTMAHNMILIWSDSESSVYEIVRLW